MHTVSHAFRALLSWQLCPSPEGSINISLLIVLSLVITRNSCCSIQGRAFDLKSLARVLIISKAFSFQSNKNDNYVHSKNQFWLGCALVSCMQFTF